MMEKWCTSNGISLVESLVVGYGPLGGGDDAINDGSLVHGSVEGTSEVLILVYGYVYGYLRG